jgi:hypothetical protein
MHDASASPYGVAAAQLYRASMPSAPSATTPYGEAKATGSKSAKRISVQQRVFEPNAIA